MKVLLIFIDGFGLGPNDLAVNPLVRFPGLFFPSLLGGPLCRDLSPIRQERACLVSLDATLGVSGLPQSATGQTALFTGVNASKAIGHHVQAFPGPQLAAILAQAGVMGQLKQRGYRVTSANMYTPNYMDLVAARKRRHSASTLLILAAGESLRTLSDMLAGEAVYQDITNQMLLEFGFAVPRISATEAGRRLVSIASEHEFTLFEYFQTDRCGHKQNWQQAKELLATLDEFLVTVHETAPTDLLVIVTSDHGNFEDLHVRTHTLNPVPGLVLGSDAIGVADQLHDLTDITPAILSYIEKGGV